MAQTLNLLREKIIAHPYFQKTKDIIENNACHKNESVYDHLLATAKRAEDGTTGEFIIKNKAKGLFNSWMSETQDGVSYKDIAILIALIHDIGKILVYEEDGKQISINRERKDGTTIASGHEYWGATIVPKVLSDVGVEESLAEYIANIVKLHGILMFPEFDKSKTIEEHISDMKTLGRGFEKEILFNIYADLRTCPLFVDWIDVVLQMFNSENLYQKRGYFVA